MEKERNDMLPIVRNDRNKARPSPTNTRSQYRKMAETIKGNPQGITAFQKVIQEVMPEYAMSKGELTVLKDGETIYFSHKGTPFTNFGAIPLKVEQIHSTDGIRYEIELLIMGKGLPPQKIKVESSKLDSGQWGESLGVSYICEKSKLWNLKVLIKSMAQYAPTEDYFLYSGWKFDSTG